MGFRGRPSVDENRAIEEIHIRFRYSIPLEDFPHPMSDGRIIVTKENGATYIITPDKRAAVGISTTHAIAFVR